MKKLLISTISTILILAFTVSLNSCKSKNQRYIDTLIESYNSEIFQAREMATGLFSSTNAELKDNTLLITMNISEALPINLNAITPEQHEMLRQYTLDEFRTLAQTEPVFKNGLMALEEENIPINMTWIAVDDSKLMLSINATDVLK